VFRRKLPMPSLVFLGLSVAAGLLAVLLMKGYARRLEATRPDVGQPVKVVVANRSIARGATVTPEMVRADQRPSAFAPPDAVAAVEAVVGRVLAADVAAGEVLTLTRLAGTESGPVAALVPAGLRAFLIPSSLPAEAIRTGDRVDVLAAFGGGRPHVETVAAGIEVGQVMAAPADGGVPGVDAASGPSLVLLVDAETAERLTYALTFGTLAVAIDPPGSDGIFTSAGHGTG
jgi:pilus assembly protein CpaB